MKQILNFALLTMAAIRSASAGKTLMVTNFPQEDRIFDGKDGFVSNYQEFFKQNTHQVTHIENPLNSTEIISALNSGLYDTIVVQSHGGKQGKISTLNLYDDRYIPMSEVLKEISSAKDATLHQVHLSACHIGINIDQLFDPKSFYYNELNKHLKNDQLLFLHGDQYTGNLQSFGDRLPHLIANKQYSIIEALLDSGEGLNVVFKKDDQLKVFVAKTFGRNGEEWSVENYRNYLRQVAKDAKDFEVQNNILAADAKRPDIEKLSDEELTVLMGSVFIEYFSKILDQKDSDRAQKLISTIPDINLQNQGGWTALMFATSKGHLDTTRELIAKGADLNLQNKDGWTALMFAISNGHLDTAKELIAKGAELNLQDKDGWTALMDAASNGNLDIARELITAGANPNLQNNDGWTALMYATHYGHSSIVNSLIKKNADVSALENSHLENLFSEKNLQDPKQTKDLFEIAFALDEKIGIKFEVTPDFWEKFFHFAVQNCDDKQVDFLLKKGVKFDEKETEILLQEINSDPKKNTDLLNYFVLKLAENGNFEKAKEIVTKILPDGNLRHKHEQFDFLNHQNSKGYSLLMYAAQNGDKEFADLLLKNGASISLTNKEGESAYRIARKNYHETIAKKIKSVHEKTGENYHPEIIAVLAAATVVAAASASKLNQKRAKEKSDKSRD